MLPLFPYRGMLRPIIMVLAYAAGAFVLHAAKNKPWKRKVLLAEFAVYCFFVIYATFLSRSVAQTYSYRLQAFSSARAAFALDGNLWDMIRGDFSILHITAPKRWRVSSSTFCCLSPWAIFCLSLRGCRGFKPFSSARHAVPPSSSVSCFPSSACSTLMISYSIRREPCLAHGASSCAFGFNASGLNPPSHPPKSARLQSSAHAVGLVQLPCVNIRAEPV